MRLLPLIAGAVLFAAPAKADKFWLSDPKAEQKAPAGSSPNVIEGVLIAESDEGYHVRLVGGEILLPKQSVFKIEKDDLTLDAIAKAEKDAAKEGELANEERRLTQDIRRREREVRAAEASVRRADRPVEVVIAPAPQPFDPVIGVAGTAYQNHQQQLLACEAAWQLTKDRRYLTLLRQLRRLN